jgi:DNA-binding CsgD family transcriptional regulator
LANASPEGATATDHGVTAREIDMSRQFATGKTNAEIAETLFISQITAKTHVANLLGKLGVESRAAAQFGPRDTV